uniref:Uncharacterized protein n=1 Tax=Glossina palpalis gambiensis TaxID=67801 RepID=A0A1B0AN35_9MUSC
MWIRLNPIQFDCAVSDDGHDRESLLSEKNSGKQENSGEISKYGLIVHLANPRLSQRDCEAIMGYLRIHSVDSNSSIFSKLC